MKSLAKAVNQKLQALVNGGSLLNDHINSTEPCVLCSAKRSNDVEFSAIPGLCNACWGDIERLESHCLCCGIPLPQTQCGPCGPCGPCGRCLRDPPCFTAVIAPLIYSYPVDALIKRFKYQRQLWLSRTLSACIVSAAMAQPRPDCLVPVPLHRRRLLTRGFNQAYELAKIIGSQLQLPVNHTALRRVRATQPQSELKSRQRRRNLKQAFNVKMRYLNVRHVALVDDVMTTGTTANECARILRQYGVQTVQVWVAARAVR